MQKAGGGAESREHVCSESALASDQPWPVVMAVFSLGQVFHKTQTISFLLTRQTDLQKHHGSLFWSLWLSLLHRSVLQSKESKNKRMNSLAFNECSLFGMTNKQTNHHSKHGTVGQSEEIRF